jgi:hypothetical protein
MICWNHRFGVNGERKYKYSPIESCNMIVKDWIYVDRPTLDTTVDSINEVVYLVSYLIACFSMSFCSLR